MRANELLGVALRIMGLWNFYEAANAFVFVLMKSFGVATNSTTPIAEDKFFVGFHLFLALILLLAADKIVKFLSASQAA